jgi:hypothetical protein
LTVPVEQAVEGRGVLRAALDRVDEHVGVEVDPPAAEGAHGMFMVICREW